MRRYGLKVSRRISKSLSLLPRDSNIDQIRITFHTVAQVLCKMTSVHRVSCACMQKAGFPTNDQYTSHAGKL